MPAPGLLRETIAVFDGCISGRWRVEAKAPGVAPDGTRFKFVLPETETRPTVIKCREPKR